MKYPASKIWPRAFSPITGSMNCTPQAKASTAGARPKLMTSARESSSRPKSLVVLVMRAMRPSRPSRKTAAPMAIAAKVKCRDDPPAGSPEPAAEAAAIAPLKERRMAR